MQPWFYTMKCSNCEFVIYLLPEFQFCPRCGFRLEHGQDIPPKEQKIASAVTSEHPKGDGTGGKYDTGTSEEQVRGKFSVTRWFCGCKPCSKV